MRPRQAGFTLIEALMAGVLLVVGTVAASMSIVSALDLSRNARDVSLAVADLSSAVELVQGVAFHALPETFPDGAPIADYTDHNLRDERIVVTYPQPGANPLEVRVTISWLDARGDARSAHATVYRTK